MPIHGHSRVVDSGSHSTDQGRTVRALLITFMVFLFEVRGGLYTGSLALLADAGLCSPMSRRGAYLAGDARRAPDPRRSYGYRRFEVLAALANASTLFVVAGGIVIEAMRRVDNPPAVLAGPMLAIAVLGLVANGLVLFMLHGGSTRNLNLRGAYLDVLGDLLGAVAAISAAVVILASGWMLISPLLSVPVAVLILGSAWRLVRDAIHVLLEGARRDFDSDALAADLVTTLADVENVHHVHAWSLTPGYPLVTLHVRVRDGGDAHDALRDIKRKLARDYGIEHATVQIETGPCVD